jgi:glycosyltransferase involved in cell wall biosynthesis
VSGRRFVLSAHVGEVGGAAKAARLLCEALARTGEVTLFVTLPPEAETRRRLESQGIEVVVPWASVGWRLGFPARMNALRCALAARRERPALVLGVSLGTEARLLLRLPRAAPIHLWETTEALPGIKFVDPAIHRWLDRAASILVPSSVVERNVRATYGYEGAIGRLPFWVEPARRTPSIDRPRSRQLLYVGRFDPDKGLQYLFEAFRRVRAASPGATLAVFGAGPIEPIRSWAAGLEGVEVGGRIGDEDYHRRLEMCDAVVLPSLHEGYPLTLLEACAHGRPVIATTVGSIPEVFGGRACALLVPPRDVDSLAARMQELLADDDDHHRARCRDALSLFTEVSSPEVIARLLAAVGAHPSV